MKRKEALDELVRQQLNQLSNDERTEILSTLLGEVWDSDPNWQKLPQIILEEFNGESLLKPVNSARYDAPILLYLKDRLKAVTNDYLKKELKINSIEGLPAPMVACPCCGRKTIETRGTCAICLVCWWEDIGQDNHNADKALDLSPNYGISLTLARYFFLKIGIYNPKQIDLKEIQEDKNKYPVGRTFKLLDNKYVIELGTDWKGEIKL